jgi:hypothetical protein
MNNSNNTKNPNPNFLETTKIYYAFTMLAPCMDIIIWPPSLVNLDDDDIAKIDEEVGDELNTLFASSMSLNDKSSVQLGDFPSTALDFFPLATFSPSIYTDRDWEVDDVL